MREYAKVSPRFWTGKTGKEIKKQGTEAVIVALYLMSSPMSNMIGLYYCPKPLIIHESGLSPEGASEGLQRVINAGFCSYDEETEMVWVHEMARFQIGEQLLPNDKRVVGIEKDYLSLPNNMFLKDFYDKYKNAFHLKTCRGEARGNEGASEGHRSQEQEQEQEQENKILSASDDAVDANLAKNLKNAPETKEQFYLSKKKKKLKGKTLEDFTYFWKAFAYSPGKAEAADAWLAVYSPEFLPQIISAAQKTAAGRAQLKARGMTPIYAQGWLSGRRWEDEADTALTEGKSFDCNICDYKVNNRAKCHQENRKECTAFRRVGQ